MKRKTLVTALAFSLALPLVLTSTNSTLAEGNESNVQVAAAKTVGFTDVSKSHWAYDQIVDMKKESIIFGYPDGSYKPNSPIRRDHVAALFVRSLDLKPIRAGKEFKDVSKSHSFYDEIQAVYRAGIFDGSSGRQFKASSDLTRAEMAKVLVDAFDLELEKGTAFDDVSAKHWAKDYIATIYANGITVGDNNGDFNPEEPVTRAQYAAFLHRSLHPDEVTKPDEELEPAPEPSPTPEPTPTPVPQPDPEKPAPQPEPVLPAVPDTDGQYNTTTGLQYEGEDSKNVPTPSGYVAGTHEKANAAAAKEIVLSKFHYGQGMLRIDDVDGTIMAGKIPGIPVVTLKENLTTQAEDLFHITYDQLIDIMNDSMKTGKLYDGETFTMYFDYQMGVFKYSYSYNY